MLYKGTFCDGVSVCATLRPNISNMHHGKSQKEVKYKLKALMEEEKNNRQLTDIGSLTVQSWIFQYLKDYKANEIKVSTLNTYMTFYRKHI